MDGFISGLHKFKSYVSESGGEGNLVKLPCHGSAPTRSRQPQFKILNDILHF
jgi:hypothetical protein